MDRFKYEVLDDGEIHFYDANTRGDAYKRGRGRRQETMAIKNPPHPGLSVRLDCLDPLGLSITEAARRLGVSRKQLSSLVNGRSGISPEMAIRLDKAFGGGASTWYQMQAAFDLAQAVKRADEIDVARVTVEVSE